MDSLETFELPRALDDYVRLIARPEATELASLRQRTAQMPFVGLMLGSPAIGQLLQFLIKLTAARRVLEVGVFTGCTTLAMASAIPEGGTVVAVDISERWASVGREYWRQSGVADRIDLRIGTALEILDGLVEQGLAGSFDLAFVDANKDGYDEYLDRCLTLLSKNGVIVFDNVLFGGRVHPSCTEAQIRLEQSRAPKSVQDLYVRYADGLRRFNAQIAVDSRVDLVVLPMNDGVTLARKR
jgi:O-methyltransferase